MKRATMTLPDDLAKAVDDYVQAQEAPPAIATVVQAALLRVSQRARVSACPPAPEDQAGKERKRTQ
jgi:hypothetical protein